VIEILDPLAVTGVLFDRVAGTFSGGTGADKVATRSGAGDSTAARRSATRPHRRR
jgi:hypothetical protein